MRAYDGTVASTRCPAKTMAKSTATERADQSTEVVAAGLIRCAVGARLSEATLLLFLTGAQG